MKWSNEVLERKSEEFEQIASKFKGFTLQELEASYFEARGSKDDLNQQLKSVNQVIMVLESIIAEKFAEDELKTVSFDNGNRLTVLFEWPVFIQDKDAFINWLKSSGREFELTVYAASTKRIVKEYQEEENAQGLPPGIAEGEVTPVLTYTRRKP